MRRLRTDRCPLGSQRLLVRLGHSVGSPLCISGAALPADFSAVLVVAKLVAFSWMASGRPLLLRGGSVRPAWTPALCSFGRPRTHNLSRERVRSTLRAKAGGGQSHWDQGCAAPTDRQGPRCSQQQDRTLLMTLESGGTRGIEQERTHTRNAHQPTPQTLSHHAAAKSFALTRSAKPARSQEVVGKNELGRKIPGSDTGRTLTAPSYSAQVSPWQRTGHDRKESRSLP